MPSCVSRGAGGDRRERRASGRSGVLAGLGGGNDLRFVREQRAAERLVAQEVEKLFSPQQVRRDLGEHLSDLWRKVAAEHAAEFGLGQITQSVTRGAPDELVEIDRLVYFLEMIVIDVGIRLLSDALCFCEQHGAVR